MKGRFFSFFQIGIYAVRFRIKNAEVSRAEFLGRDITPHLSSGEINTAIEIITEIFSPSFKLVTTKLLGTRISDFIE